MNIRDALGGAVPAFKAAGCDTPRLDAEVLIGHALGIDRATVIAEPEREIPPPDARLLSEAIRRRTRREPVAYITGTKGFRHIDLQVDSRVLIPRPESELLVKVAAREPEGAHVHDLGTGSGAIALAVKQERPDLTVTMWDSSVAALEVAGANAECLGLDVAIAAEPTDPDLTVANLPYVEPHEWDSLAPEIREYEPREALIGDVESIAAALEPGRRYALEHAPHQAEAVRALLDGAQTLRDLSGRERVSAGVSTS